MIGFEPLSAPLPAFTIAANNYLPLARVFVESYLQHHPAAEVRIILVDRRQRGIPYESLPAPVLVAEELEIPGFRSLAFRYQPIELATAVKPAIFRYLRDVCGWQRAAYFDPDVWIADSLPEISRALDEGASVVLTPHITAPLEDGYHPSERSLRMAGIYNLGFLAMRLDPSTAAFLSWWESRCRRFCYVDPHHGLFVDQSWIDFAPSFLDRVAILRSPRFNLAYWNLAQRHLENQNGQVLVNGEPLGFLHWSGFDPDHPATLSRHQNRFLRIESPVLAALLSAYRSRLFEAGFERYRSLEPGYGRFEPEGQEIPPLCRKLLSRVDPQGERFRDPFDQRDPNGFWAWLREPVPGSNGLLTRAALAVWEIAPEAVQRFPDPLHQDRESFLDWLREVGMLRYKLPPELLKPVRSSSVRLASSAYLQQPHRPLVHVVREEHRGLETIDLSHPGSWTEYLLEPLPLHGSLTLPRLAQLLWLKHPALQEAFQDPLGKDRRRFLAWLARYGVERFGLAPELVEGLRSIGGQAALDEEELPGVGQLLPEAAEVPEARTDSERRSPLEAPPPATGSAAPFEVLFLAASRRESSCFHRASRHASWLQLESGISSKTLDLDRDFLAHSVDGYFQPPDTTVPTIVVLDGELELAPWRLGWLPSASAYPARKVAYFDWGFEGVSTWVKERLTHWDEIWTPSRFAAGAFAAASPVPVHWVAPGLLPDAPPAQLQPCREELRDALEVHGWLRLNDPLEREDPWTWLKVCQRLFKLCPDLPLKFVLEIVDFSEEPNAASEAGARLAAIRAAAGDLPVTIRWGEQQSEPSLLILSTNRTGAFSSRLVEAVFEGALLAAPCWGFVADFLTPETGCALPFRKSSLDRSWLGAPPGQLTWISVESEAAADAVASWLQQGPSFLRQAQEQLRKRVISLYGQEAFGRRWTAHLLRLGGLPFAQASSTLNSPQKSEA